VDAVTDPRDLLGSALVEAVREAATPAPEDAPAANREVA
jgi:hypothetical protein